MKICPKCKTEYREGFNQCADCKIELVDIVASMNIIGKEAKSSKATTVLSSIFGGILLMFVTQIIGMGIKDYLKEFTKNIDMSHPINLSILTAIPPAAIGACAVVLIIFWLLEEKDRFIFALGSSVVAFCVNTFLNSGGIIGILLLLDDSPGFLIFALTSNALMYAVTFIVMLSMFKIMNHIFTNKGR